MRTLRLIAATALAALVPLAGAAAETYPGKQVRFVVPYPAGGPLDTVARLLGQAIATSVKQPVVVENVAGAGGNIGAGAVPELREKMLNLGAEPVGSTPEEFAAFVKSEAAKYAKLVKASGAKVD